jgi:hypothetical protein
MVKMNKKGFLKIVEAMIAILLIAGAILINYSSASSSNQVDYSETARDILKEIADNEIMRGEILSNGVGIVSSSSNSMFFDFAKNRIPEYLSFEIRLCSINSVCGVSEYVGNIYSAERIISSDIYSNINSPVKIRLFIWEEGQ